VAGRLHTARSRNDIDMTMYRMRQRGFILDLLEATLALRGALTGLAQRHRHTVFAAHTHTQPAQPTTLAHYLLGVIEQLERDAVRLRAAYATTNRGPLGACAITGTGFPVDRYRTSALLGFDGPTGNTYGSIATVDYLLESLSALSVAVVGVGRFLQDLLLWCTLEFQYLRLPDGFVQGSSIMPQKRNPVALEHARGIASKALGQAMGVMAAVHNTPFGDIVDTEDDLQPLVRSAFRDATRAVALVGAALAEAEFNAERMAERAGAHWITVTELADTLTRDDGLSFKKAHEITSRLVALKGARPELPLAEALEQASADLAGGPLEYSEAELADILCHQHFVHVRRTPGGPAPEETAHALTAAGAALARDERWLADARERLRDAAVTLRSKAERL
jgi:argininosuccinate lyase